MAESGKGKLFSKDGKNIAVILDTCSGEKTKKFFVWITCEGEKLFSMCSTLRKSFHCWQKKRPASSRQHQSPFSRTNFRFLNTPEKSKRYSRLRARHAAKSKRIERLQLKVSALIEKGGVKIHLTSLK
jgi:hypothetical protein